MRGWMTACLMTGALLVGSPADAAMKVAVVDVQKVMEATGHWKEAVQRLETERTARQAVLEKKQKELRKKNEQIEAKAAVVAPDALLAEKEELQRDAAQLTEAFMQNQRALTALEQEVTGMMLTRVNAVVQQIAQQEDYAFVFETGPENAPNVLFSQRRIDITKIVTQTYEKAYKGKPLDFSRVGLDTPGRNK